VGDTDRKLPIDRMWAIPQGADDCRRAIERILTMMKKRYEDGEYSSRTEAEVAFRKFVKGEPACQKKN
jgi:hypothetical protein